MQKLKYERYVLIVNMGNYLMDAGGTNKVVFSQEQALHKNGYSVVCIYPWMRNTALDSWGIIVDGVDKGVISSINLNNRLISFSKNGFKLCNIIIHHLKNVNMSKLDSLLDFAKCKTILYVHDFYMICPEHYLMIHSNGKQCTSKYYGDVDCASCQYYTKQNLLVAEMHDLIRKHKEISLVVAPSSMALNRWSNAFTEYKGNLIEIPHQKMVGVYSGNNVILNDRDPLKIGFVGAPTYGKGWEYWVSSIIEVKKKDSNNEEFHKFGHGGNKIKFQIEHDVGFHKNTSSMVEELRKTGIHCAVLWSIVKETYSYTYFESLSANAFVLTNSLSGNIAKQVIERGNGIVVERPDQLKELLLDEDILRKLVNGYRKSKHYVPMELIENDEFVRKLDVEGKIFSDTVIQECLNGIFVEKMSNVNYWIYRTIKKIKSSLKKNPLIEHFLENRSL